jgi:hypothetical protein
MVGLALLGLTYHASPDGLWPSVLGGLFACGTQASVKLPIGKMRPHWTALFLHPSAIPNNSLNTSLSNTEHRNTLRLSSRSLLKVSFSE